MWKSRSPASCDNRKVLPKSTRWRRRMGENDFFCCEYFEFSSLALVAYPTGDNYRTNHGSSYCATSWRHGWQVAIPSICKRGDTTYVVISRETERFLNEIHNHYGEVRSSKELLDYLQESKEGKPYEESKVTVATSKLGQPSVRRKLVQSLSPLFQTRLLFTSGNWSLRMRKSGLQFMLIQDVDVTWQFLFPKQSRPCYVISIKTNESLVVRDIGSLSNQYWWECLHMKEREISVTKRGNKRSLKPAQSIELSTVKWRWNCGVFLRDSQGHSGGIPTESEFVGCVVILRNGKRYIFHRGFSWNFQSILWNGLIPGKKRKKKPVRQSFQHQRILWKWLGGRRASWRWHSSTESSTIY